MIQRGIVGLQASFKCFHRAKFSSKELIHEKKEELRRSKEVMITQTLLLRTDA